MLSLNILRHTLLPRFVPDCALLCLSFAVLVGDEVQGCTSSTDSANSSCLRPQYILIGNRIQEKEKRRMITLLQWILCPAFLFLVPSLARIIANVLVSWLLTLNLQRVRVAVGSWSEEDIHEK